MLHFLVAIPFGLFMASRMAVEVFGIVLWEFCDLCYQSRAWPWDVNSEMNIKRG